MPRAKWSIAAKLVKPECNSETTIGLILRNLDLKRFVNKDCNQTIESITQTIFKSWFVDFDPVRAKVVAKEKGEDPQLAAMLAISGKSAEELSGLSTENYQKLAATADLFPEELVETEHGEVPRGWEWKSVEDMLEINPRLSLKKNKMAKYTDMKALPTSGYSIGEFIYKEYKGGAKFQQGDVLLARIAPCLENGKTGIVDFLADNEVGFGSTEFIVLRKKNSIKTPFVACLARYESFVNHCIRNMVGTSGRQRVQNSCFQSFFVALPNNDILDTFNDKMEVLFANLTVNSEQSRSLAQIRDTLLPKLLSGELQITQ